MSRLVASVACRHAFGLLGRCSLEGHDDVDMYRVLYINIGQLEYKRTHLVGKISICKSRHGASVGRVDPLRGRSIQGPKATCMGHSRGTLGMDGSCCAQPNAHIFCAGGDSAGK